VKPASGLRTFSTIWFGQFVSTIGSGLTGFAVGVWIYQTTGSVTDFALSNVFYLVPFIALGPVAGALVDRWDRRWVMIIADAGQALGTLAIALLYWTGHLQVWHIYITIATSSILGAFQRPAYSASVTLLVPKEQLGRAGGMGQLKDAVSGLVTPTLAGFLVVAFGLTGVILIDFATFLFAVTTLLLVRIPSPEPSSEIKQRNLRQDIAFGVKHIVARPGLFGLLVIYAFLNLFTNAAGVLTAPMVLSFAPASVLGIVSSVGGAGLLTGGLLMSLWGGPKRLIHGALGMIFLTGLGFIITGLRPSAVFIATGTFLRMFAFAVMAASAGALWQRKVAPDLQGRVFATRFMISASIEPLAHASIGPLVDRFFGPWLMTGGLLAGSVGAIIGLGPGRGMGFVNVVMGILILLLGVIGYVYPRVRRVEDELPDATPGQPTLDPSPRTEALPA